MDFMDDNPLTSPPLNVIQQSLDAMKKWFDEEEVESDDDEDEEEDNDQMVYVSCTSDNKQRPDADRLAKQEEDDGDNQMVDVSKCDSDDNQRLNAD